MFEILQSKTKYYALQSTVRLINGNYFNLMGNYFTQTERAGKKLQEGKKLGVWG